MRRGVGPHFTQWPTLGGVLFFPPTSRTAQSVSIQLRYTLNREHTTASVLEDVSAQ